MHDDVGVLTGELSLLDGAGKRGLEHAEDGVLGNILFAWRVRRQAGAFHGSSLKSTFKVQFSKKMGIVDIGQREGDAHGGNLGRLLPAAAERRNGSSGRAGDEDLEEVERDRFSTGLAFNGDDAAIELAAAASGKPSA